MTREDVALLMAAEARGETVISWHAKPLWDALKDRVTNDEEALRLSRLLRINQHHYLLALAEILRAGAPDALLQYLSLNQAGYRYSGEVDPATLQVKELRVAERQATYAASRAGRIARIALDALVRYDAEPKRNIHLVAPEHVATERRQVQETVTAILASRTESRERLIELVDSEAADRDNEIAELLAPLQREYPVLREALRRYMSAIAGVLVRRFERGTYTREGD